MRPPCLVLALAALVALAGSASAGSRDAPEVTDAADDCAFALGNEYGDIVSAWISDETAMDFHVNIELAKWTHDALGAFTGYTLQFTHQGVQWGVVAFHEMGTWSWSTAFIDPSSGEMGGFNETHGEWDASTRTMSILFPKSLFPHEGDDSTVSGFIGGSADFKKDIPIFVAQGVGLPVPGTPIMGCDLVESSAVYTFTVGQHTMHGAPTNATPAPTADEAAQAPLEPAGAATPDPATQSRQTPLPSLGLALVVLGCLAASTRAR